MFTQADQRFRWQYIRNIDEGRPSLGDNIAVSVYRLMQFSLRAILNQELGIDRANDLVLKAGKLAGSEFCRNVLDTELGFEEFAADLQRKMKELSIGILRIEEADAENMEFVITIDEDPDCSGLPVVGTAVCDYHEGFIAGILSEYEGKPFVVREIDCCAFRGSVCRFLAAPADNGENYH